MKKISLIILLLSTILEVSGQDTCCYENVWQSSVFEMQEDPLTNVIINSNPIRTNTMVHPLVADLDNNGIHDPEIITLRQYDVGTYSVSKILITPNNFPSAPIRTIDINMNSCNMFSLAVGDVLPSIPGLELVVVDNNNIINILHSFPDLNVAASATNPISINTNRIALNQQVVGSIGRVPLLADIDGNGTTEIILGEDVYYHLQSTTGTSLTDWAHITSPTSNNASRNYELQNNNGNGWQGFASLTPNASNDRYYELPVVADVWNGNSGHELILGNQIFSFNGTSLSLIYDANEKIVQKDDIDSLYDGYVSVGDVDGNGVIDVVVNGVVKKDDSLYFGVYVYEPQTNSFKGFIQSRSVRNADGHFSGRSVTLGEIDPLIPGAEIIWLETDKISIHNITLNSNDNYSYWQSSSNQWNLPIDDPSGQTGITVFDFNGDGEDEIVYRDEDNIRIINGSNSPPVSGSGSLDDDRNWSVFECLSGTGTEFPVIADYDLDGEAEIITTGAIAPRDDIGYIRIFESVSVPWGKTVPYWNQNQYNYVNVKIPPFNSPLTVPNLEIPGIQTSQLQLVSGQKPYNRFMGQPNILRDSIQYHPDFNINVLSSDCNEIKIEICNSCPEVAPIGTPIRVYNQNPTSSLASLRRAYSTPQALAEGECLTMTIPTYMATGDWYIVVNDNGNNSLPYDLNSAYSNYEHKECTYNTNMAYTHVVCDTLPPQVCECTELGIWNYWGTPDTLLAQDLTIDGSVAYAEETFEIHTDAAIPITELKVNVTDIDFQYNHDQCAECINNPALWGSVVSPDNTIGTSPNSLNQTPKWNLNGLGNLLDNGINRREIVWQNPNGAMLKEGDLFKVGYLLPAISEIPCCASKVKICIKISWKDANCCQQVIYSCSEIDLKEKPISEKDVGLILKKEGCCQRVLTVNTNSNATYNWSTGATSKSITVSKNGTYTVDISAGGTTISKTILVNDIMAGDFPLLSFNSLFHPDFVPPYKNKFYVMDISPGKIIQGVPNSYNANEYKLEIWHRWNTQGGQGNPLKVIQGAKCDGFNNWDIFWDGTDQNAVTLKEEKSDSYVWRLTLKNCTKESSRLTYRTTWNPNCGDCIKWKKFLWWTWCAEYDGCWNTETFEFGDVQLTK